jgi:hypothetical protein
MIKIENRTVVFNETLIIPKNESATIETEINGTKVIFEIRFTPASEPGKSKVSWTAIENSIQMTFDGWISTLGTAINHPTKIGELNSVPLGFIATHQRIGETDILHFQILMGGLYEQV